MTKKKFKKIFVLGSNSFAGSVFINKALNSNIHVVGISRSYEPKDIFLKYKSSCNLKNFKFFKYDLNNNINQICDLLDEHKPNYIIDFAGQGMVSPSWETPWEWYNTNLVSKTRLHRFLIGKKWLEKYIRISTPEVYGSVENLIKPDTELNPSTPYAISHAAIDLNMTAFYKEFDFPMVLGRFANFYGPGQQMYRIIPKTFFNFLTDKKLPLHGSGASVRSFLYSDDIADAIFALMYRGNIGKVYLFSSNEFITIKDLVKKISMITGVSFEKNVYFTKDRIGKDMIYKMDSKRSITELNWKPKIKIDEGLIECFKWAKENVNNIDGFLLDYIHKG